MWIINSVLSQWSKNLDMRQCDVHTCPNVYVTVSSGVNIIVDNNTNKGWWFIFSTHTVRDANTTAVTTLAKGGVMQ